MTREERDKAIRILQWLHNNNFLFRSTEEDVKFATEYAIKALEQEPCEDCISRQALLKLMGEEPFNWTDSDKELQAVEDYRNFRNIVEQLPSVNPQKIGHCKDCKWWKDSNGAFRRGIGAESICRINTDKVYQGDGYCYLFEPQETETWNGIHTQITAPKGTFERLFNEAEDDNDI